MTSLNARARNAAIRESTTCPLAQCRWHTHHAWKAITDFEAWFNDFCRLAAQMRSLTTKVQGLIA
jgi:hypothetical protein